MMLFEEKIKDFTKDLDEKTSVIHTEETTKISLILPFLRVMGYDTTNPLTFRAEYTADIGVKQGEKVDFAILKEDKPEILIECKSIDTQLEEKHLSQLLRYYSVTEAQLGILTNGIIYQFYTDSDGNGKMDVKPFFEVNLNELNNKTINRLKKFTNDNFDVNNVSRSAQELKYNTGIKKVLINEFENPSDEFIKAIAKQVYDGQLYKSKKELFSKIIKAKIKEIIDEKVDARLDSAINTVNQDKEDNPTDIQVENELTTTPEEWEGYYIIKGIGAEIVDPDRITIRDREAYCNVLFDDNQYYPIARLHFNNPNNLKIELFDTIRKLESGSKRGNKINITNVKDIYKFRDNILTIVERYKKEREK